MTIERAAEILDPESKEKFYGESGKQEVFEAMRLAKAALEKKNQENRASVLDGKLCGVSVLRKRTVFVQRRWTEEQILRRVRPDA